MQTDKTSDQAVRDRAYDRYFEQKGWSRAFEFGPEEAETFAAEVGSADLSGRSLLEIGFGSGSFLGWARRSGAEVVGCEINEEAVALARREGIELISPNLESACAEHDARFDLIIAFDVFEHLPFHQIVSSLHSCSVMLKPGSKLILRFPNAQSPFGLAPQYGDVTHVTALSPDIIEQLLPGTGLRLVDRRPAHRVLGPSRTKRLVRRLRYLGQKAADRVVQFLYPNPRQITLAPVVVVILERKAAAE